MKIFRNLLGLTAFALLGYGLGRWRQSLQISSASLQIPAPSRTDKSISEPTRQDKRADAKLTTAGSHFVTWPQTGSYFHLS